jgi:hypothetical protein
LASLRSLQQDFAELPRFFHALLRGGGFPQRKLSVEDRANFGNFKKAQQLAKIFPAAEG